MSWLRCALVFALPFLASCSAVGLMSTPAPIRAAYLAPQVPFRTLVVSNGSSFCGGTPAQAIFHSKEEEQAFFAGHNYVGQAVIPSPDFSKETGILVLTAGTPYTADSGEIFAIEETSDAIVVHSVIWAHDPTKLVSAMAGQPWHYVSIPHTSKPIRFEATRQAWRSERPSMPLPGPNEYELPQSSGNRLCPPPN